jgi:energy-coupling factor transporter ATP-binding protein EcfA2
VEKLAEQSDKEGWPAARFLAALAEHEVAERGRRRIERHLAEARLPVGKTLATFDFQVVPMVSKAQVMALAAGDSWLEKGANLLLFGPPGAGKSHLAAAIGLALVDNGWRVLFMRTSELVQRLQIARRELGLEKRDRQARQVSPAHPRLHRLCQQGPGRDQRAVRADRQPLRAPLIADHRQSALRRVGQGVPRPGHDARRHRPPRASRHHPGDERRKLSPPRRPQPQARSRQATSARDNQAKRLIVAQRQSTSLRSDNQKAATTKILASAIINTIITSLPAAASHSDCRNRSHPDCRATFSIIGLSRLPTSPDLNRLRRRLPAGRAVGLLGRDQDQILGPDPGA